MENLTNEEKLMIANALCHYREYHFRFMIEVYEEKEKTEFNLKCSEYCKKEFDKCNDLMSKFLNFK